MKPTLLVLFMCLCAYTNATTYYFSSSTGDDSRSSTQASNPATPWKSLNKLNAFFGSIKPGDVILLKRGDTFEGNIIVTKSGTAKDKIVIGAYGTGSKPVISGFKKVTGWKNISGNIWESNEQVSNLESVNMLTINDVQFAMGRYPNANAANKGYLTIEGHSGKTSITSKSLSASQNWTGATAVVRTHHYILDTCRIKTHAGNTLTFSVPPTYDPINGYGFFIENHANTLDQDGEWFFNQSTKKLQIFSKTNPASLSVKVATIKTLVSCYNVDFITIENVRIEGADTWGTYHYSAASNTVKSCDIVFCGDMGISCTNNGNTSFLAESNYISDIGNYGINCRFAGDNQMIRYNTIKNIGLFAGMGGVGTQLRTGIATNSGKNNMIEQNFVDSTGFIGIRFGGNYTTVRNNVVSNFTLVVDDGGGIYTANHNGPEMSGRKVINNIIFNGAGAPEGTNNSDFGASSGIYLDDNTSGVEVDGNTAWNCGKAGLFAHNAFNIKIINNLFYNNRQAQIEFVHDNAPTISRINCKNNIAFSRTSDQYLAFYYTKLNDIANFGSIDSNYYVRPMNQNAVIRETVGLYTSSAASSLHSLPTWKLKYGKDKYSNESPKLYPVTVKLEDSIRFEYNSTANAKTIQLDGEFMDVKKATYSNSVTLQPYTSIILFKTAAGKNNPPVVSIIKPLNNTTVEEKTNIDIEATAVDADGSVTKVEFYNGSTLVGTDVNSPYTYNWTNAAVGKYILTAKAFDNKSLTTTSAPVTITVSPKKKAPAVELTSPVNAAQYLTGENITISALVSDEDGVVKKVEFYAGTTYLGVDSIAPYTFVWTTATPGTYALKTRATDNHGLFAESATRQITVANPSVPPVVDVTFPSKDTTFIDPASVLIQATAVAQNGQITKVEFYDKNILIATDNSFPYSFVMNNPEPGTHSITARASDSEGNATVSPVVPFNVVGANAGPIVNITAPSSNAVIVVPSSITLAANARDIDGQITKVEFYDGQTLIGTDLTSPYSIEWYQQSAGQALLTAKAFDNSGNSSVSDAVRIQFELPNQAPEVSLISPQANAQFDAPATIEISASAVDPDGSISKVEFYYGETLIATDFASPYTVEWENVLRGDYQIRAKAYDNNNASATSESLHVVVNSINSAPSIIITSPSQSQQFDDNSTVNVDVTAYDNDGVIRKLELYNGTTLIATDNSYPYSFELKELVSGEYNLTVVAIDNSNDSSSVSVKFTIGNIQGATNYPVLTIRPNPVASTLNIFGGEEMENKSAKVNLIASNGFIVQSFDTDWTNGSISMNVGWLTKGAYVLQIVTESTLYPFKFIKW